MVYFHEYSILFVYFPFFQFPLMLQSRFEIFQLFEYTINRRQIVKFEAIQI